MEIGDLIPSLVSTIIGGFLSLLGAWAAIKWNAKNQRQLRKAIAIDFFKFLIEDQLEQMQKLVSYRSANSGQIAYLDLQLTISNYGLFERNREHLIYLNDNALNKEINSLMFSVHGVMHLINNIYNIGTSINNYGNKTNAIDNAAQLNKELDRYYYHIPTLIESCKKSITSLNNIAEK